MSEKKKEDNQELKVNYRNNNQMTLKPTQKIRRKNKKTNLQKLYNEGKVRSEEFYVELVKFIKWRLMPDLIRRGYYINGVRQNNFTRDECDACYTHVLRKILNEYSPAKGTLATYVRWQIRGWGQLVIQKQVRNHRYNPKGMLSLESSTYNIKIDNYKSRYRTPEDSEGDLDRECFGSTLLDDITTTDVEDVRKGIQQFKGMGEDFEWWV